ncbi:MAG TPA: class I SAM-dependent methyltransferase [Candidatus Paceibacterota bacterium]
MTRQEFLEKNLANLKSGRVLDVGNLEKRARIHIELMGKFKSCEFYGLDLVDQSTLDLELPNQHMGSFESAPFTDNFFDAVYMGQVLEHTYLPLQTLKECRRVLKDSGMLILDLPNVYSLSRQIRFTLFGREDLLGNDDHKIFYSPAMLRNLLDKSGFKNIFVSTENVFSTGAVTLPLPNFHPFKNLGESLIASGQK